MTITRTPVDSSNVASLGHDPDSETMHVEFKSGKVYEYSGVDADTFDKLLTAPSVGSHFAKHIRSKYDGTALD
jgi:hypothetical protein